MLDQAIERLAGIENPDEASMRYARIVSELSPRAAELGETWQHSVVARGTEIIHDPHPSRAGVLSHDDVVVLVPFDPGRIQRP